jgi:hypothetical protein
MPFERRSSSPVDIAAKRWIDWNHQICHYRRDDIVAGSLPFFVATAARRWIDWNRLDI